MHTYIHAYVCKNCVSVCDCGCQKSRKPKQKHSEVASEEAGGEGREDEPRQCYGPGCVEMARQGSKYCSDECGLKLATK